jgi:hypothetical protein
VDDDGSDEDDVDDLLMMESAFPVRRGVWQICTCASRGEIGPLYRWHKDKIYKYIFLYIYRARKEEYTRGSDDFSNKNSGWDSYQFLGIRGH